jgi:hypothetical protein
MTGLNRLTKRLGDLEAVTTLDGCGTCRVWPKVVILLVMVLTFVLA